MPTNRFEINLAAKTREESVAYVRNVLDPQIEELTNQLRLLQTGRRALAQMFDIDRREGVGPIGEAHDRARRAEFEGDETTGADGRIVPPGASDVVSMDRGHQQAGA